MNTSDFLFKSSLAGAITDFISFKHSQGYDYRTAEYFLRRFDNFLYSENYSSDILSQVIVDKFLSTRITFSARTKCNCFSMLTVFSQYLNTFKAESWICNYTIKCPLQIRYYLYTKSEVKNILATARSLSAHDPVIADCIAFILGLLYCTGLRINEAMQLQLDDIDFNNQTLFIKKGKFRKSRYIVLDSTVVVQLKKWLKVRDKYVSELSEERLFINSKGEKVRVHTVRKFFYRIIHTTKIGETADAPPRLHDFRHTYACNCIEQWRKQGDDVNIKLPVLSTAMGHVHIQSTQIYMHVTAINLHDAAERFHNKIFKS